MYVNNMYIWRVLIVVPEIQLTHMQSTAVVVVLVVVVVVTVE